MIETPKTVYIFSNGNVACYDDAGQQIPELQQKSFIELWFEWLETQGIDPREIKSIQMYVNGRDCQVIPIKGENWSYHFIDNEHRRIES